jgi:hypothetical protein
MLKRKRDLNYRKAVRHDDGGKRCKVCVFRQFVDIYGCNADVIGRDWRCEPIGIQNSRKYSIAADHICDCFKMREED